jgi:hypothetical protein
MDPVQFPKTFDLRSLLDQAETESKKIVQECKITTGGKITIDSAIPNFNVIKKITIASKTPNAIKTIALQINNYTLYTANPDPENRTVFTFDSFDINGIVQDPKLFEISFVCNPTPPITTELELSYYGVAVDQQTLDFLKYNQYYSVHKVRQQTGQQPDEQTEKKGHVLVIYYAPVQSSPYNVKFLDLKDIPDFMNAINLNYQWEVPPVYKFETEMKKESHRMISVECDIEMEQKLCADELLKYETHRVDLGDGQINKSFIVPRSERPDIEGHLMAEYGLIPYVTIVKIPRAEIDYVAMKRVRESQIDILKKINR